METIQLDLTEITPETQSQIEPQTLTEPVSQAPQKIDKITICGHQPYWARNFCRKCYKKAYRKGILPPLPPKPPMTITCGHYPYHAKGLCERCYLKLPYSEPPHPIGWGFLRVHCLLASLFSVDYQRIADSPSTWRSAIGNGT